MSRYSYLFKKIGEGIDRIYYREDRGKLAIYAKDVSTAYPKSGDAALVNVSLEIPYNTISLITGPNGSGKTTLLELILGFLRPLSGELLVLGYKMPKMVSIVRRNTSYLPQNFMRKSSDYYTVREVIIMGLASYYGPFQKISKKDFEFIEKVLKRLDLWGLADREIGKLSGGQQQRVMMARALARRPKLILLDEPFSCLDKESRVEVSNLINTIRREFSATILIVSHVLDPIIDYADLLIEICDGRVVKHEWIS